MPRISVVVPIYNVEPYLAECLESIAAQTFGDLEVVMVDDGSTDASAEIASGFAARDERFRLITQANGGLGKARNTGIDAATGEFLAFVDSDDFLTPNAYELLMGALTETGSDFATGNVVRLTTAGPRKVGFLADTFSKTRLATHVTEFEPLIADRTAWNKLFRRSFWDAQGRRFPEGVLNEDIPVVIPAQFAARTVDVIADPVYYWRIRDGEELSITQRRLEPRALLDRLSALKQVLDHLESHDQGKWKRRYLESVVADDLRFYLNPLAAADDAYRELFLERVNDLLDGAGNKGIFDRLPAIERLKWHLVRRRLMPELLEVIRFQQESLKQTPPVEIRGRWYGDYPYRDDPRLKIPHSVYLLDRELRLVAEVESLDVEDGRLKVRGYAYIRGIGADSPERHEVRVLALRRGRLRRVRLKTSAIRLDTQLAHRPDVTADAPQQLTDLSWSGFEATLDPSALRTAGRWRPGVWELFVTVRAGKVKRRRMRFLPSALRPVRAVELPAPDELLAKVVPTVAGGIAIDVRKRWAVVRARSLAGNTLELTGDSRELGDVKTKIEVSRKVEPKPVTFSYPMKVEAGAAAAAAPFSARVKLKDLLGATQVAASDGPEPDEDADDSDGDVAGGDAAAGPDATDTAGTAAANGGDPADVDERVIWQMYAVGGGRRSLGLDASAAGTAIERNGRSLVLARNRKGDASLIEGTPRPMIRTAEWTGDGVLELTGELPPSLTPDALVLAARDYGDEHRFPLTVDGRSFAVTLTPARIESLAGALPLRGGTWDVLARTEGDGDLPLPFSLGEDLYERLPLATTVAHKRFVVSMGRDDRARLVVHRDLDDDERGGYHQRRLRESVYPAHRRRPLRDAVVFTSFQGRQYSDSPRAIHEELVRRELPLEHLWVVQDGMAQVPETARVVRDGSREHHEALAECRYVVNNDHFPDWFARRPDQIALQTWHGTPLKRLGTDVSGRRKVVNRFTHWHEQVDNWQYVLSPNHFSTPILQRAYAVEGEMLETGYPRNDVLAAAGREERSLAVRRRIGVPDGARTVLYAPTYRDNVFDARGRYRLDLQLDLERLRAAVGDDTVVLFRKHHYIADPVPADPHGFVIDVSRYPDGTELMLAADVLVTDYSSSMFDFAVTGRPMLFYTYDLDAYRDEIRGFYFDFVDAAPGPLLRTTDDLAAALQGLDGVRAEYAQRYADFVARFCELDDGNAARRVVDRVFS